MDGDGGRRRVTAERNACEARDYTDGHKRETSVMGEAGARAETFER